MACRRRRRDAGLAAQNEVLRERLVEALGRIVALTADNEAMARELGVEQHG